MAELLEANWILLVIALVIGLLVAWWIFVASRRTKVEIEDKGTDEPTVAKRNQSLIDAPAPGQVNNPPPPQAVTPAATDARDAEAARTAASPGETSAAANADSTAASPLGTDAETGDGVPAREAMKASPELSPDHEAAKAPADSPTPPPAPQSATSTGDDLRRIKGVGPKLVTMLHENGVTTFEQIAGWSSADIDRIDAKMGRFQGRIRRDNWVEQARLLQSGDLSAYEAKFGSTG